MGLFRACFGAAFHVKTRFLAPIDRFLCLPDTLPPQGSSFLEFVLDFTVR